MQVRKIALVVCLLAGMAAGAATPVQNRKHRAGKMDDGVLATILTLVGLYDQFSIPPG